MSKPEIFAKASFTKEQFDGKVAVGCDGIEIQLLNEMYNIAEDGSRTYKDANEVYDLEGLLEYPVRAIHAPLIKGLGDMTIENMMDIEDMDVLNSMFRMADYFGKHQDRDITLIIHSESFLAQMKDLDNTFDKIIQRLDILMDQYLHVKVGIENVTPIRGLKEHGVIRLSNNFGFDNIEMVEKLRKELRTDKVGTILDTCHAMITKKYTDALYAAMGEDGELEDYSMEHFFELNRPYCLHFHFAGMKGSGYGKGRHGVKFDEENKYEAFELLDLYKKFDYTCPLCLEVEESDFIKSEGYASTKKIVEGYYDR